MHLITPYIVSEVKHTAKLNIRDENLVNLQKVQRVINAEEGVETSLDDSLKRVLDFYRKYVPYN
ncbi:MAG: hypothetical protein JSV27_12015 [Candidatus Bathyarchaeota archaeon]|nr:MAG: hypothetical protein JSV27_12015 [Candidatus Bathyarchaeota archaeon]